MPPKKSAASAKKLKAAPKKAVGQPKKTQPPVRVNKKQKAVIESDTSNLPTPPTLPRIRKKKAVIESDSSDPPTPDSESEKESPPGNNEINKSRPNG